MNDLADSVTAATATPRRRRRWVTLLLVSIIFVAGMVVGAGTTIAVVVRNMQMAIKDPSIVPDRAASRLRWALDLDERQTADMRTILSDLQKRLQQIRRRVYPDVQREIKRSRDEITNILNHEQKREWNELYARLEHRWFPPPPTTPAE